MRQIGTLGTIDTLTIGERVLTDIANMKVLFGEASPPGNTYCTFKDFATNAAYVVPGGKTFVLAAIKMINVGGGGTINEIGTGTSDVGFESATPPTGAVSLIGTTNFIPIYGTAAGTTEGALTLSFGTGKYIYAKVATSTTSLMLFGYEV